MIQIECTSSLHTIGRGEVSACVTIEVTSTILPIITFPIFTPITIYVSQSSDNTVTSYYGPGSLSAGGLAASTRNIPAIATASNNAVASVLGGDR